MEKKIQLNHGIAEFIGTFAIVFFGCGAVVVSTAYPNSISPGFIPIIFGLVVSAMIYTLGHISGAHFNPAVTAAFAIIGKFPARGLWAYWTAQILGAIAASSLLAFLFPYATNLGMTLPSVPAAQALLWEFILTFFLMFVVMGTATDNRATSGMAGLIIGVVVMLDAFVGGPVTGASMNPARSLAPALVQGNLSSLWIYMVGPLAGTIVAAKVYGLLCYDRILKSVPLETKTGKNLRVRGSRVVATVGK